jgi:hypothetical protein
MIEWKVQCFFCNPGLSSALIGRRREVAEWRKTLRQELAGLIIFLDRPT